MPKRMVVFLDGTWNRADHAHASNVVRLMRCVRPMGEDGQPQIVYYDKGVGTGGAGDRWVGGLTGRGLEANIRDAYLFLGNNYQQGDEIHIFGFSRGAFTARSLAGFVASLGLLDRASMGQLPQAWRAYRLRRRGDAAARGQARREAMAGFDARPVRIACIGVWDTVGALGIPMRWGTARLARRHAFHDTTLHEDVAVALHALAIDEKRGPFGPALWQRPAGPAPAHQHVEQVWFPGSHSDVGGGGGQALADWSLQWMVQQVSRRTRLALDDPGLEPDALAPMTESRSMLYAPSWLLPYDRVLGGRDGWSRRVLPSRNRPLPGHVFSNEAIHPSALLRLGQEAPVGKRMRKYAPANLQAAIGHLPTAGIEIDAAQDLLREAPETA